MLCTCRQDEYDVYCSRYFWMQQGGCTGTYTIQRKEYSKKTLNNVVYFKEKNSGHILYCLLLASCCYTAAMPFP